MIKYEMRDRPLYGWKNPAPRHYRSDEEPEQEWVSVAMATDLCAFCGHHTHDRSTCPSRPLISW